MADTDISKLYKKLKKNQIRIISVKYEDGELSGTLRTVTLPGEGRTILYKTIHRHIQEEFRPKTRWAALSYLWGDPTPVNPFTLNGIKTMIHLNLYQALRQVCQKEPKYPLWTDFLCINQADQEERSHHIRMMDQIYAHAYLVWSYLGESNESTQSAVDFLAKLYPDIQTKIDEFVQEEPIEGETKWVGNAHWMRDALPPEEQRDGVAREILAICYNDYFHRSWILQEIVLARYHQVLRGSVQIDAGMLYDFFSNFAWRVAVLSTFYDTVSKIDVYQKRSIELIAWPLVRRICTPNNGDDDESDSHNSSRGDKWPDPRPTHKRCISWLFNTAPSIANKYAEQFRGPKHLWYAENPDNPVYELYQTLLQFAFQLECTMPEDCCLSLIGLLKWGGRRQIGRMSHLVEGLADAIDTRSVYMTFATRMLHGPKSLVVLSWAAYSRYQEQFDLPSWCPNFHRMGGYWLHANDNVENDEAAIISYNEVENSLTCYGVRIGTVLKCMKRTWKETGVEAVIQKDYEEWRKTDLPKIRPEEAITLLEDIWELFQHAVRVSPRVKQSFRDKIQHCSMDEAGISFLSSLLSLEEDTEAVEGMDTQLLIAYLQNFGAFATLSEKEAIKELLNDENHAYRMVSKLDGLSNQYYFITDNGYFGSSLAEVQCGDVLVILAGAKLPFVLRQANASANTDKWHLATEAYVSELTSRGAYINQLDPPSVWPTSFKAKRTDTQSETNSSEDTAPEYNMPELTLRWRARESYQPTKMKMEGHDFDVPSLEGKHENFVLI